MVAVPIAWITIAVVAAWVILALVVALVVGRVVRRGDEDALLYGSLAASVRAWVAGPSVADPGDVAPAVDP